MMEVQEKGEIESDGQSVWIYTETVKNTRFGPLSVQYGGLDGTTFFSHGTEAEAVKNWDIFVQKAADIGIIIGEKHRPVWLPLVWTDLFDMLADIKRHVNKTGAGVIAADSPPLVGFVSLEHHPRKWEISLSHIKAALNLMPDKVEALGVDFRTGRGRKFWASNQRKHPAV